MEKQELLNVYSYHNSNRIDKGITIILDALSDIRREPKLFKFVIRTLKNKWLVNLMISLLLTMVRIMKKHIIGYLQILKMRNNVLQIYLIAILMNQFQKIYYLKNTK